MPPEAPVVMPESTEAALVERVRFSALDGYPLGGLLFTPATSIPPKDAIVFAAGGGVRAVVYRRFLSHLAARGMPVFAFDYRGIGESRPGRLRDLVAGFEDWAELDTGAAIEWMRKRYPGTRLAGIGHSVGAVMIAAPAAARDLAQLVCIAPHTGYFGDYRWGLRWMMKTAWRLGASVLIPLFGYFPAKRLGLGEDLPARIARQWSACTSPGFDSGLQHGDAERGHRLLRQGAQLRAPTLVLSFLDDPWSTEAGIRRFLHGYRNLLAVRRVVKPSDIGKRRIGHWGFFRRSAAMSLWPMVVNFLSTAQDDTTLRCVQASHG